MSRSSCSQSWLVEAIRDGRVIGAERSSFERHLSACAECAELSTKARAAREGLKDLPSGLPDVFTLRRQRRDLLRALDDFVTARAPRRAPRFAALTAARAVAMLAGLGVWHWGRPRAIVSWVDVEAGRGAAWSERTTSALDRITLLDGRFRLMIHRPSPVSRVLLTLPDGEIEDLGTVLEVRIENHQTMHVAVQSGQIVLRLRGFSDVHLRAGEHWDLRPAVDQEPRSRYEQGPAPKKGLETQPSVLDTAHGRPVGVTSRAAGGGTSSTVASAAVARQPANSPTDRASEDAAYLRVLELLESRHDDEALAATKQYLARYPRGFRRLEALAVKQRLARLPN